MERKQKHATPASRALSQPPIPEPTCDQQRRQLLYCFKLCCQLPEAAPCCGVAGSQQALLPALNPQGPLVEGHHLVSGKVGPGPGTAVDQQANLWVCPRAAGVISGKRGGAQRGGAHAVQQQQVPTVCMERCGVTATSVRPCAGTYSVWTERRLQHFQQHNSSTQSLCAGTTTLVVLACWPQSSGAGQGSLDRPAAAGVRGCREGEMGLSGLYTAHTHTRLVASTTGALSDPDPLPSPRS